MNFFEWLRQRWLEFRGALSDFMQRFLNRLAAWLHRICATLSNERLGGLVLLIAGGVAALLPGDQVRRALDRAAECPGLDDARRRKVALRLLGAVGAEEEYPVSRQDRLELDAELGPDMFLVELP